MNKEKQFYQYRTVVKFLALLFAMSIGGAHAQQATIAGPTPPNSVSILTYGASASASDNATAIQAAINAAVANGKALYIPSAATCYKYTAPLTISGNLTIIGDSVNGNWPGTFQVDAPASTPALLGSVLCPSSNGSDAIDINGTALSVNISNIGILFQTLYTGTGNGIVYVPSGTNQGLSGSIWQNVLVYGHDGSHYAISLTNPIYNSLFHVQGYGGGLLKLAGNSTTQHFGNSSWIEFYCNLFVAGSAHCFSITASQTQALNLEGFFRPQANVNNLTIGGVTPPTSAQYIWSQDSNATNVNVFGADWETNVASPIAFGNSVYGGIDWNSFFSSVAAPLQYPEPSVVGTGILYQPKIGNGTLTNTTATGTVALEALYHLPGWSLASTSATTYTVACTLCVDPPINGTNTTAPRKAAIYATGEIFTTSDISSSGGAFFTGTAQINQSAGVNTTSIGNGTTSGTVTIGGASNSTLLSSATLTATNLATDATHTDRTVCQDTTSKSLFFGSGTLGVCLGTSSARFKHNISDLNEGLDQIMRLRPVSYEYNADHGDPNHELYGFTAEDMAKTLPKLVGKDSEGKPNSADYLGVVPVLVKGMQQLKAENDNLRACNDNWKCRIFGIR